jgi:hypothetical protein
MKKDSATSPLNLRRLFIHRGGSAPAALPSRGHSLVRYRSGKMLRYAKDGINYLVPVAVLTFMASIAASPWWLDLTVAVMVFSGLFFLFNPRPAREQAQVDLKGEIREKLTECGEAAERLRELAPQVANAQVQGRLAGISATAANLVAELRTNPSTTLTNATRFEFVLSETMRLLEVYLRIERGEISAEPEKLRALARKVEDDLLPRLELALRDFAVKLDQSDLLSLEATIGVLESTLKVEGLS